jgi:hypothetical protein
MMARGVAEMEGVRARETQEEQAAEAAAGSRVA